MSCSHDPQVGNHEWQDIKKATRGSPFYIHRNGLLRLRTATKTWTLTVAGWLATALNWRTRWLTRRPISQLNTRALRTRLGRTFLVDITRALSNRRPLALIRTRCTRGAYWTLATLITFTTSRSEEH